MTPWDLFFDQKVRELAKCQRVIDLGGGTPFMKHLAPYKNLFDNVDFKTVDNVPDFKPDIVSDIEHLDIADNFTDGIICKAVLEHVKNPHLAVAEMYRILQPGGKALVYVPFLYSYHGNKHYKDYYRYTRDGLEHLFRDFSQVEIVSVRGAIETLIYLLPFKFIRKLVFLIRPFDRPTKNQASGYSVWLVK